MAWFELGFIQVGRYQAIACVLQLFEMRRSAGVLDASSLSTPFARRHLTVWGCNKKGNIRSAICPMPLDYLSGQGWIKESRFSRNRQSMGESGREKLENKALLKGKNKGSGDVKTKQADGKVAVKRWAVVVLRRKKRASSRAQGERNGKQSAKEKATKSSKRGGVKTMKRR